MKKSDIILKGFSAADVQSVTGGLICVYNSPKDYPGLYVARLFGLTQPTPYIVTAQSLNEIRAAIPADMICFGRDKEDDPCIVETWI